MNYLFSAPKQACMPYLRESFGAWTRVAALFYSLIESAKPCGVEPRASLGEAAKRTIRSPGTVTLARDPE